MKQKQTTNPEADSSREVLKDEQKQIGYTVIEERYKATPSHTGTINVSLPLTNDVMQISWGQYIGTKTKEQAEVTAKLICDAVNNYQSLVDMVGKFCYKLQEHQTQNREIVAGYTLAANIPGMTELLNEATRIYQTALNNTK
jgi:hypothetical protein